MRIPNKELELEFDRIIRTEPRYSYMRELEKESERILYTIGNLYNDGIMVAGVSGGTYYYNMYDGNIYLLLDSLDEGILLAEEELLYLNFMDGTLYGMKSDGSIVSYVIPEEKETILRDARRIMQDRKLRQNGL